MQNPGSAPPARSAGFHRSIGLLSGTAINMTQMCALAACDAQPDVRLMIHASQPLARDCLERMPEHLTPQVPVAEVRRARPNEGVEYEVRGGESRISIFQDFATNVIEVSLTSEGSPDQKRESLGLLKNVHHGVLSACNLDPAKDRVDRSCTGDACKDPAYPGL